MEKDDLMFLFRTILKLVFKNFQNLLISESYLFYEFKNLNDEIDNILSFEDLEEFKKKIKNFFENYSYFFEFNFYEDKKEIKEFIKTFENIISDINVQINEFKIKLKNLENEIYNIKDIEKSPDVIIILKKIIQELINFLDFYSNEIQILKDKIKILNEKAFKFEKKVLDLEKKAFIDKLTSVYNRRAFELKLKAMLSNFIPGKSRFALFFFDLDNFKEINDTYGHLAGDLILKKVAELLKKCTRNGDIVCRYGGDEFVILISDINKEIANNIGKRIIEKISNATFIYKDNKIKVKISGGAYYVEKKETFEEVIRKADQAMYEAKQEGNTFKIVY